MSAYSQVTSYVKEDDLPTGRWPDNLAYNHEQDVYKLSLGALQQIVPLDHIHVINFDVDVAPPYAFTLQLPMIERLPNMSRLFIFYVSYCHDGDILTFIPSDGTGNSINGNLVSWSYTLPGAKQLFFCAAFNGNYIIHPFGGLSAITPVVNNYNTYNTTAYGLTFDYTGPPANLAWNSTIASLDGTDWMYTFTNGNDGPFYPSGGVAVGTNGLVGQIIPDQVIPPFDGFNAYYCCFQVLKAGYYGITYHLSGNSANFDNNVKLGGGRMRILDSTGTVVKQYFRGEAVTPGAAFNAFNNWSVADHVMTNCDVGDYVWITAAYEFLTPGTTMTNGTFDIQRVCFMYYGDSPPAPAPPPALALRSAAAPVAASSESSSSSSGPSIIVGSSQDNASTRISLARAEQSRVQSSLHASSIPSAAPQQPVAAQTPSPQPSLSLSDVEAIVRQVIRSSSSPSIVNPSGQPLAAPAMAVSAPKASSSSSRKRARVSDGGEVEK